jgi:hypothetical protein
MSIVTSATEGALHEGSIIPKVLKKGSRIKLKHYSTFEPIINTVVEVDGNKIIMFLPDKLLENNILEGDVIVCVFLYDQIQYVFSGIVAEITFDLPAKMIISVENVEKIANLRKNPRYSVSLIANVKKPADEDFIFAVVRNVSVVGASVTCHKEFKVSDQLIIKMATAKDTIIVFTGRIVRMRKTQNFYEYGVLQTQIDVGNNIKLQNYIQALGEEEGKEETF